MASLHTRTISFRLLLYVAKRNLLSKKMRTGLTLVGVVIGIGAIFFLLSFGLGLQKIVTDEILGNQSIKSIDVSSPNSQVLTLTQDSLNKFSELPHVTQVGSSYLLPSIVESEGSEFDSVSYAVDPNYQSISNLTASAGRLLTKEDNLHVVVNESLVESAGIATPEEALGKVITLTIPFKTDKGIKTEITDEFEIVGVIGSGAGSEVFLPSHIIQAEGATTYSQVKLVVESNDDVDGVRNQIEALGFETLSPIDTIEQVNQIFGYFNIVLVGFGSIGMIVAVLGMFNTLTISLLERTKEIGLMLALGARSRDMKQLFVLEAMLLSVSGALIGIFGAILNGYVIDIIMNRYASGRGVNESFSLFSTPIWLVAAMVGFMVIIGLTVVLIPARRAQRISPIDALRRE